MGMDHFPRSHVTHEIRGRQINSTGKAILFHRYGDAKPEWYPLATVRNQSVRPNGTMVLRVDDWIFRKNTEKARPGDFHEEVSEDQLDLPLDDVRETDIEKMTDEQLLEHFDNVVAMLHERGVDIEQHYKENTCQTQQS